MEGERVFQNFNNMVDGGGGVYNAVLIIGLLIFNNEYILIRSPPKKKIRKGLH